MIPRQDCLRALVRVRDNRLVKLVSGIRRCGKSTLLELYADYLRADGVADEQILFLDLEDAAYSEIETGEQLYDYVDGRSPPGRRMYVVLDEISRIKDFERAVLKLAANERRDVYIASSSAVSSGGQSSAGHPPAGLPPARLLGGRCVEIKMLPLSFREYVSAFPEDSGVDSLYADYTQNGAFPYSLEFSNLKDRNQYLRGIFDTIVLRDIVFQRKFPDMAALQSVARFMFDTVGYICSTKSIADIMTKSGKKIAVHTVESYLSALTDSFIFYKIGRYDVKGKQYLKTGCKYYAADLGLRCTLLGAKQAGAAQILENIVYLELLRRGCEVHIAKIGNTEVDFMASRGGEPEYYQVAQSVTGANRAALRQELAPLEAIGDHNPKYLLTMDRAPLSSHNGIRQINILDWLLK